MFSFLKTFYISCYGNTLKILKQTCGYYEVDNRGVGIKLGFWKILYKIKNRGATIIRYRRVPKFMKRSKKIELNLNIEFGRVRKVFEITYSIPLSGKRDRNHPTTSTYPIPVEKNLNIKAGKKSSHLVFSSRPGSHINSPLVTYLLKLLTSLKSKLGYHDKDNSK